MIEKRCGGLGLRGLNYKFLHSKTISGTESNPRDAVAPVYSTFDFSKYDNETLSEAGEVSREESVLIGSRIFLSV